MMLANPIVSGSRFTEIGGFADLGDWGSYKQPTPTQLDNVAQSIWDSKSDTHIYFNQLLTQSSGLGGQSYILAGVKGPSYTYMSHLMPFIQATEWPKTIVSLVGVWSADDRVLEELRDPLDIGAQLDSLRDMKDGWGGWNAAGRRLGERLR